MNKCASCGANVDNLTTVSSIFGGVSFGVCDECLVLMKEPYSIMVDSISCVVADDFPNGINEMYLSEIQRQLKLHNKSEEEFKKDLLKSIEEERKLFE